MLTPQIRHYELWQKNSRYANFSAVFTPSYAIVSCVKKLDMLILVLTTWHTERLHVFLFEPKHFLLTWEIKFAIGLNR